MDEDRRPPNPAGRARSGTGEAKYLPRGVVGACGWRSARNPSRLRQPVKALEELARWTAGSAVGFLFGQSTVEQVRGAHDPAHRARSRAGP
jgi:hypothetical protein